MAVSISLRALLLNESIGGRNRGKGGRTGVRESEGLYEYFSKQVG